MERRLSRCYAPCMEDAQSSSIEIDTLAERAGEIASRIERGETVVVTKSGRPLFDAVPHRAAEAGGSIDAVSHHARSQHGEKGGIDLEAGLRRLEEFKRELGIDRIVTYIAPDFDDPLPEDFLLQPLPDLPTDRAP